MKQESNSQPQSDMDGLAFGAGAMSESSQVVPVKPKRKTVYIKLHPKPNAPRHSALRPARASLSPW